MASSPPSVPPSPPDHLEVHRSGVGLLPETPGGPAPVLLARPRRRSRGALEDPFLGVCTCRRGRDGSCRHLERLRREAAAFAARLEAPGGTVEASPEASPTGGWEQRFGASLWGRLAVALTREQPLAAAEVRRVDGTGPGAAAGAGDDVNHERRLLAPDGTELVRLHGPWPAHARLLERLGVGGGSERAGMLERLAQLQTSDQEKALMARGARSQRQVQDAAFWYRLAYHLARELPDGLAGAPDSVEARAERGSGRLTLLVRRGGCGGGAGGDGGPGEPLLRLWIPRGAEGTVLAALGLAALPLRSLLAADRSTRLLTPAATDASPSSPGGASRAVAAALEELAGLGEGAVVARAEEANRRWGRMLWLSHPPPEEGTPVLEVVVELERPGRERRFRAATRLDLAACWLPGVDGRVQGPAGEVLARAVAPARPERPTLTTPSRLELRGGAPDPEGGGAHGGAHPGLDPDAALGRSWWWLAGRYVFGRGAVSLAAVLEAKLEGLPVLETEAGWVDLSAPAFDGLEDLAERLRRRHGELDGGARDGERLRLTPGEVLTLGSRSGLPVEVVDGGSVDGGSMDGGPRGGSPGEVTPAGGLLADGTVVDGTVVPGTAAGRALARFLRTVPVAPWTPPEGLTSTLRPYQVRGAEWLAFLAENGLSGILADDMGLGKTHQAMALVVHLFEATAPRPGERPSTAHRRPFLVVAPTSVLSHWRRQLRDHAPVLTPLVHHGADRHLPAYLDPGTVVITSYGLLRNDRDVLGRAGFRLAVFDELQNLKNPSTAAHRAARALEVPLKLGLTGTPIENSLAELEALFSLLLPGHLGPRKAFEERYGEAAEHPERPGSRERLEELRRRVAPFILRRTKEAVLDDLPEKIEDVRLCELSDDQVALYRALVDSRETGEMVRRLERARERRDIPFAHVFSVITKLKRLCDHPALETIERVEALDDAAVDRALARWRSGKWELFVELLDEALADGASAPGASADMAGGRKVVVFTQYLGMVRLIERHLVRRGVGAAIMVGATPARERERALGRFARDPGCRVFVASLGTGGTGIDLVAASVVIHYDRWWTAAAEDQATDRVHRIGQKNVVQVFKLVTEGTLEEKIDALIERKRDLAERVIREEGPGVGGEAVLERLSREDLLSLFARV